MGPETVYCDFQVDKQAVLLPGSATPHFPVVHFLGIHGSVLVEFIVDAVGRVEPQSVRVMSTSNVRLNQPVLDVVSSMRFKPAELHGQRVKELLEMPFAFPP